MSHLTLEQRMAKLEQEVSVIQRLVTELPGKLSQFKSGQEKPEIMNAKELAAFMKIDINVIYTKCAKREIPYFKLGKQYRFKKTEILDWIKEQEVESEFSVDAYVNRYLQKNELRG